MKSYRDESESTRRIKQFVNAHLHERITARDVADAAGYSQYYAARVFKADTGISPFEFIRRERLTAAAFELRAGERRIIDVALDYVFDSHEGFTRAFANGFGIPPKRFSSFPAPKGWVIPFQYLDRSGTDQKEQTVQETAVIFTQIIERPDRKLILRRSSNADDYFAYVEEMGCGDEGNSAPWDVLTRIESALYEPVGLWLPESLRPEGTGIYAHGVEVPSDFSGDIPEKFDVIDLPPARYLVFQGEPYNDEDYQTAVSICMKHIEAFNPEVYGYGHAPELAPRMQLAPQGWRGYIEMMPVKSIE